MDTPTFEKLSKEFPEVSGLLCELAGKSTVSRSLRLAVAMTEVKYLDTCGSDTFENSYSVVASSNHHGDYQDHQMTTHFIWAIKSDGSAQELEIEGDETFNAFSHTRVLIPGKSLNEALADIDDYKYVVVIARQEWWEEACPLEHPEDVLNDLLDRHNNVDDSDDLPCVVTTGQEEGGDGYHVTIYKKPKTIRSGAYRVFKDPRGEKTHSPFEVLRAM